jgi:SAM-dependent methyltransferase
MTENQGESTPELTIPAHAATLSLEELAERHYAPDDFTRKGPSYLGSYRRLLERHRRDKLRILELGVSSGASLLVWHDYLPYATIVGVDIAEQPARIREQDNIHFIQGSQDDPAVLDRAAAIVGGSFDVIIDDASHIGYLTKRSLNYLFPRYLAPGGCYVIEDFGTGFLDAYPDGRSFAEPDWNDAIEGNALFHSSQFGMVGVVKQLVEPLMQELATQTTPYLAIGRLTIETNIVFVEKSHQAAPPAPPLPSGKRSWPAHDVPETALLGADDARIAGHEERLNALEELKLQDLKLQDLASQDLPGRINRLEVQMEVLRKALAPVRLLRQFGRRVRR